MAVVTTPRPTRKDVLERAERRERIATTVYASMFATTLRPTVQERGMWAAEAVAAAAALMAELDRRRDAELQEARQ